MDNQIEVWEDVQRLNGLYKISNLGNIKHSVRNVIIKGQDNGNGYRQLTIIKNGKRKVYYIHRLVAETFIPNPNNLPQVNHKNSIRNDNRVENLEWCTGKQNMEHCSMVGRTTKGEKSGSCKLSNQKVLAIRRLYTINPKFNKLKIAKKLGVRDTTIHKIIRRQRWNHI